MKNRTVVSRFALVILVGALILVALAACQPQTVEVTRVVTETTTEQVEVTRIVEGEPVAEVVEVTRVVEVAPEAPPELTQIDVQLGWIKNSEFAGMFVADQQGFYAEEGLEVNFISGGAGIDAIPLVRQNPDIIGIANSGPALINAVSAGAPLTAIGAFYQKHPNGFLILKDTPIDSFKDLEGHSIAIQPESEYLLDVLAAYHNLDKSKMELVRAGFDPTPLLTGQVDAYVAWIVNQPYAVEQAGKEWKFLLFADNPGLEYYAMIPFVHRDFIANHPDVLEGFMRASLRGWEWALDHPEETANMVVSEYLPGGDPDAELWLLNASRDLILTDETAEHGIGWMNPQKWEDGIATLVQYDQIDESVPVDEIMTDQFVESAGIMR
ncbi:MAG TPA: ABC transporter substrate-binding protein [Candidatus Binatia bacterium]|nr:ABC transporter substrate-binding protein [Candidatus Binatia bacterium]